MKTVLFLLATSVAFGQFDSGQISGFVGDASQAVVPGATVTAVNQGNGDQRQTVSNASGYYVFPNLVVGTYTVSTEASGFKTISQTDVKLSSAAKISVDLELSVGAVTESVVIKASTSQVQTETAQVGRTVESRQIQDLTLNGRNPIYLALLKPGVRGGGIGAFDPDSRDQRRFQHQRRPRGRICRHGGRSDRHADPLLWVHAWRAGRR